jgi:gliding motility-associated-like protein
MKMLLTAFLGFLSMATYADGPTITGKMLVLPGSVEIYTVTFTQWSVDFENHANVTWDVTGGTVISSNKHGITIQWNTLQGYLNGSGIIAVNEDLAGQNGEANVVIENSETGTSEFCNGILGPASVAENFGNGLNPGPALPAGTTTYFYNTICSLDPGEYTVRSNSNLCRSAWHNIPNDHTGNANGYFLMINANDSRNEIYRKKVSGLNTSFQYEFSAWVGNLYSVDGGQDPNIRFEIYALNGNSLGSSGTIVIPKTLPAFQWQRVGFMFTIPTNVSDIFVVIVNTRSNTQDAGNDMVVDDISFAPCYPAILASFSATALVEKAHTCNNGTVTLYSRWPSVIPFTNPSYQWQKSANNGIAWSNITGATTVSYTHTESTPGIYQYRMLSYETSNPSQFVTSNSITYYVQTMVVDAHTEKFYTCNGSVPAGTFPGFFRFLYSDPAEASILNFTYQWTPATYLSNTVTNPTYIRLPVPPVPAPGGPPAQPINYNYTLKVTNTNYGCSASNIQTASVQRPRKVGVANAFAPTQAPPNNVFVPINIEDYPGAEFWVYNRWGENVFYSKGPTKADYTWNGRYKGKLQPADVYYWTVTLPKCPNNIVSASHGDGVSYGDVTLLR